MGRDLLHSPDNHGQLRGEIQTISSLQGLLAKENGMSCLVEARLEQEGKDQGNDLSLLREGS